MPVSYNTAGVRSNAPISPPEANLGQFPLHLRQNGSFVNSEFRENASLGPMRQGAYYASQIERSPGLIPSSDQIMPLSGGENSVHEKRYASN